MSEEGEALGHVKDTVVGWIMKGFSFILFIFCVLVGIMATIVEYVKLGPLEQKEILVLIAINVAVVLMISSLIKRLLKHRKPKE